MVVRWPYLKGEVPSSPRQYMGLSNTSNQAALILVIGGVDYKLVLGSNLLGYFPGVHM